MSHPRVPVITSSRFQRFLRTFRKTKVLVVGDLMLDEFVWGRVSRISPEAPVPVVWVQSESMMPGGAANVANNIRALGGQVQIAGVVGADPWGQQLTSALVAGQIGTASVLRDPARRTTVKTRVIAHHQQVVRVDREQLTPFGEAVMKRLIAAVRTQLKAVDAIIIEDYGKGVITRRFLEEVLPLARSFRKIVTVDPKEEHIELYQHVTAITPNRAEAGQAIGRRLETEEAVLEAGEELLRRLQSEAVLITLGEDGMRLFEQGGRRTRIPTVAQEVFDVVGAGDTVIAIFTLALASGASMSEAAVLANHAAGIVVGKLGVAVVTPQELSSRLDRRPGRRVPSGAAASRLKAVRSLT